jgi:D-xylose transport system substrate-binding protein
MIRWQFWFRMVFLIMICSLPWISRPQIIESRTLDNKPIKIGLAMATLQEERWRRDRDFFTERLRQLGAELIVQNANNNSMEQTRQVAYLLSKKIRVLVIVPDDLNQAAAAVQLAKKAGVKVISYDRLIRNADLDLYLSFDNIKVGQFMAEFLVNKVPAGKYVIINGAPSDHNSLMFNEGYKRILNPYIQDQKITIAFETWAENWRPEYAYQYIQGLLTKKHPFDAVIAANDNLASAVIEALAEWRLAGKVMVVGHDADLSGCQRIVEGTQLMTVYKPIRQLAFRAADMAMALAANKEIKTNYAPIFNGKHWVPAEIITPIPIDRDNMNIIIRDGFHRKEEIYLNVPRSKWPK